MEKALYFRWGMMQIHEIREHIWDAYLENPKFGFGWFGKFTH